ncbi:hypothetical protein J132_09888 [Termitomyces sp. J132]|nr:hypothetical protein H2248_000765 [Termitomyces sp. 'cryptogamus']KNZ71434.1 hypothetical protein J132_09888 [Termitomyces sp. J132]
MKPREYCCCAIPIVNAGIYTTLVTQFVIALVVAIVSVATPSIVGAATPSFSASVLGAVCFVAAAIQSLGFIGVAREKPILFRRYVTLHVLISLVAFAIAAAWAIISAARHSTSKNNCLTDFFTEDMKSTLGQKLCDIIPWVDVGIMGGLWVILAIFQLYLFIVLSSYSAGQSRDHEKYDQLSNDTIPMNARNDPWDSTTEAPRSPQRYTHVRNESTLSTADVLAQPQLQPNNSLSHHSDYQYQPSRKTSTGGTGAGAGGQTNRLQKAQYQDNYYNHM